MENPNEEVIDLDELIESMVNDVVKASKPRTDELQYILDSIKERKYVKKDMQEIAKNTDLSGAYILTKEEFSIIIETLLTIIIDIQEQNNANK